MTIEKATDGVSPAEAAELLGVHHQTIRNWIKSGRLPATRFGPRRLRIDTDDLDRMRTPSRSPDTPQDTPVDGR